MTDGCTHERTVIRRKLTAVSGWLPRSQCKDCGHYGKGGFQTISKAELRRRGIFDVMKLPEFDEDAFARASLDYAKHQRDRENARRLSALIERSDNEEAAANDPYYSSPEWKELRQLVIARANGVCEGCGKHAATQVHHLHYRTFTREFLWDLRAVCRGCHERVHDIQHERNDHEIADALERVGGRR